MNSSPLQLFIDLNVFTGMQMRNLYGCYVLSGCSLVCRVFIWFGVRLILEFRHVNTKYSCTTEMTNDIPNYTAVRQQQQQFELPNKTSC